MVIHDFIVLQREKPDVGQAFTEDSRQTQRSVSAKNLMGDRHRSIARNRDRDKSQTAELDTVLESIEIILKSVEVIIYKQSRSSQSR